MKRLVTLEIPEGRLAEIFDRLHKAEQEISDCYNELRYLGVVTIQPKKQEGTPILPPPRNEKKTPKPHIGDHSRAGGSRVNLQTGAFIVSAILHQLMEGDNFKLVIEVADGVFVVNRYPME